MPGVTQVPDGRRSAFAYWTVTICGWLSHTILLAVRLITSLCRALQPPQSMLCGFGLLPVRSPLLGEYFLFLWVLRCFSSPGCLPPGLCVQPGDPAGSQRGVSPFGHPRIKACIRLPEAFRSIPRPSSAFGAKASTISPCVASLRDAETSVSFITSSCSLVLDLRLLKIKRVLTADERRCTQILMFYLC